jgi:hypothetical protein
MNMLVSGPGTPQDALYFRTPITPEQAFQAIGRLRKEARDEIDRLIRFLDKTDDYVSRELEDGVDDSPCDDDEREASFSGVGADGAVNLLGFDSDELEADSVRGGDAEAEPSLGAINAIEATDQTNWASGGWRDLEGEHGDREIDLVAAVSR